MPMWSNIVALMFVYPIPAGDQIKHLGHNFPASKNERPHTTPTTNVTGGDQSHESSARPKNFSLPARFLDLTICRIAQYHATTITKPMPSETPSACRPRIQSCTVTGRPIPTPRNGSSDNANGM